MTESKEPKKRDALGQLEKFRDAAREAETDDNEARFDALVRKVSKPQKPKSLPKR